VLITTCTAEKRRDPGLLPAVERYTGPHVAVAAARARVLSRSLWFVSGAFGLISGDTPIPWYDHALRDDEVPGWVEAAVSVLRGREDVVFLAREIGVPGWRPYHRLVGDAAERAGVKIVFEEFSRR